MATRNEKDQEIQQLVEEIGSTSVFYLADTSELNAEATSQLRRECHKQGIRMRVVKNTLLRKALERIEERDYSELYDGLVGPTSILLAEKGNAPAKVIENFRKKHPKPVLKSAWVDEAVFIGDDQIGVLSKLKGKEELIGDIIMLLQSPMMNVISGLQGSGGHKIAGLVKALEERAS
ncbi:MAG: 50S ribosomal protein L10 [Flavobacteriales bacterium]|nr:50S ribosomal protein L10 [Flavobacteriales bacterium]MCB0784614.1 50S ribosomal protein L10 [Flavobacteriales bacterium]MCB0807904.1 50S ribosomal protein L10 [Flavobacteriales bacterium]MCB0813096.1 50S ribosomal protein L10 [Flavobacteriales bacterium]MCB0817324.1 50S ribosomal protein L10 [Flavobacteriales bacterium]